MKMEKKMQKWITKKIGNQWLVNINLYLNTIRLKVSLINKPKLKLLKKKNKSLVRTLITLVDMVMEMEMKRTLLKIRKLFKISKLMIIKRMKKKKVRQISN
jgi:hypothetical protein